jgi:two-component system, NarL family, nitrate/nitrite response regulator NarL
MQLTPREVEVVKLMAEGLSNKQLAVRLGISTHTAKFHVNSLINKSDGVHRTRLAAVVTALKAGLVKLEDIP